MSHSTQSVSEHSQQFLWVIPTDTEAQVALSELSQYQSVKKGVSDWAKNWHEVRPSKWPGSLQPGYVVNDRYRVGACLGRGGMCEVYKAHDLKSGKNVALKTPRPMFAYDQMAMERFHREAIAMAKLKHANVVEVYSTGCIEGSRERPYLAIELVDGVTLADLMRSYREQRMSAELALPIFMKILEALEHAHANGIVHRDLKPGNVMIGNDGDTVKVIDFGVAKISDVLGLNFLKLTQAGETVGSAIYMSPEQCLGRQIDERTDLYSMGCLMYETLEGLPPFRGSTSSETMRQHVFDKPKQNRWLDKELGNIVMWALAKDPAQRPASSSALKQALMSYVARLEFAS